LAMGLVKPEVDDGHLSEHDVDDSDASIDSLDSPSSETPGHAPPPDPNHVLAQRLNALVRRLSADSPVRHDPDQEARLRLSALVDEMEKLLPAVTPEEAGKNEEASPRDHVSREDSDPEWLIIDAVTSPAQLPAAKETSEGGVSVDTSAPSQDMIKRADVTATATTPTAEGKAQAHTKLEQQLIKQAEQLSADMIKLMATLKVRREESLVRHASLSSPHSHVLIPPCSI